MLGPIDDCRFYHDLGLCVIPAEFAGKRPKFEWKEFQKRRPSIEEIEEWCRVRMNVALVMGQISGLVAVDADSDAALDWIRKNLPESICQTRTPNGEHHFYSLPEGIVIGNRARLKGLKLDVRGNGGYVLAAPSLHPSGSKYERRGDWLKIRKSPFIDPSLIIEWPKSPFRDPIEPEVVKVEAEKLRRAHGYARKVPGAISGQGGHKQTFSLACKLVRNFDLCEKEIFDVLNRWNETCEPRWSERELIHKAQEALRAVNGPKITTFETRSNSMLTVKNPREDRCVMCRKTKQGGEVEFIDKRFPGPVFMCWGDMEKQVKPEKPKAVKP